MDRGGAGWRCGKPRRINLPVIRTRHRVTPLDFGCRRSRAAILLEQTRPSRPRSRSRSEPDQDVAPDREADDQCPHQRQIVNSATAAVVARCSERVHQYCPTALNSPLSSISIASYQLSDDAEPASPHRRPTCGHLIQVRVPSIGLGHTAHTGRHGAEQDRIGDCVSALT